MVKDQVTTAGGERVAGATLRVEEWRGGDGINGSRAVILMLSSLLRRGEGEGGHACSAARLREGWNEK